MIELFFIGAGLIAAGIENVKKEVNRQQAKERNLQNGQHWYHDGSGREWYDDTRVSRHHNFETGHDQLISVEKNSYGRVMKDFTQENIDKDEMQYQAAKEKGKRQARDEGKKYYKIPWIGERASGYYELATDKRYIVGIWHFGEDRHDGYAKVYYKRVYDNALKRMKWDMNFLNDVFEITKEEYEELGGDTWGMKNNWKNPYM